MDSGALPQQAAIVFLPHTVSLFYTSQTFGEKRGREETIFGGINWKELQLVKNFASWLMKHFRQMQ